MIILEIILFFLSIILLSVSIAGYGSILSKNTKSNFLNRPKVFSQSILIIEFNKENLVSSFIVKNDKNLENIPYSNDKTMILGEEKGLLKTYFNNMGKFSQTKNSKKHSKK